MCTHLSPFWCGCIIFYCYRTMQPYLGEKRFFRPWRTADIFQIVDTKVFTKKLVFDSRFRDNAFFVVCVILEHLHLHIFLVRLLRCKFGLSNIYYMAHPIYSSLLHTDMCQCHGHRLDWFLSILTHSFHKRIYHVYRHCCRLSIPRGLHTHLEKET